MRLAVWSLVALALVGCRRLPPRGSSAVDLAGALPRLVLEIDEAAPSIYLTAAVWAGSAHDPVGSEGLASLTARALVEGGAGELGPEAFRASLYPTGNTPELVVDKEWVTLRLRCHRDQADLCVDRFADLLTAPRFDEAVVERLADEARYDLTEGLADDEERLALLALEGWLFGGHRYGHPVVGRSGVIDSLDREDVVRFHREHYLRASTTLGMAGAVSGAAVQHLMERMRGLEPDLLPDLPLMTPEPVAGRSLLVVETGSDVVGYRLGHSLDVPPEHPDHAALVVAFTAFGSHRQSFGRLFRSLRGQRGLNYGTYAYFQPFRERRGAAQPEQGVERRHGYLHLWVRPVAEENAPFALKLTLDELERFVADGLTAEELQVTKAWLDGAIPLLAADPGRRLAYATAATATEQPDPMRSLREAVAAVTLDDVRAALQRHVRPDDLRIVAVGGDGEGLVAALTGASPTPMVYADGLVPDEAQAARDAEVAAKDVGLTPEATSVRPAEGMFR